MYEVVIAGIGQTPVGEHWERSLRELAGSAIAEALKDAPGLKPQALYVGNMLAPAISRQSHLGSLIADYADLGDIEAVSVEAAGASSAMALRMAYLAIMSGAVETALVLGVEKLSDQVPSEVEAAEMTMLDADFETIHGLTPTAQAAMLMQRYMHEYNVPREAFSGFAVNAHANGVANPYAMFRKAIKPETYTRAGMVAEPLNLFDVAPNADGAAALILTRRENLPADFPNKPVLICGSAAVTDKLALHDRENPLSLKAASESVKRACEQAEIQPGQADLFELFDAFSIYSALSLEAAGFAAPGEGWKLAQDGAIGIQGNTPITTFGGLKARGNPGGAAGAYQAIEAVLQLRGLAGENQVAGAKTALIQSLGGPGSTAVTHVLQAV
jgi:acetyl-CoA C-acetyltransferase